MARRSSTVGQLAEHPNLSEVLGVLAHLAHIDDADVPKLARAWTNSPALAEARDRALSPDSPLVLEVLSAFEALSALFDDDLRGEAAYVTNAPTITITALKAVRDAIAATYARPVLRPTQYAALMRPWRTVFPTSPEDEPDLGPQGEVVKALLAALPQLAARCHDPAGRAAYDALVDQSFLDESDRAEARESAFQAAVLTSRRRLWALVRRSAGEGLLRGCPSCGAGPDDELETRRVLQLCRDAACALLVADALPDRLTELLTAPVARLIPTQRGPSS